MTIESQLAQLQQAATEQTEASVQLANNITEGLQEIDQVKQDIAKAYDTVSQNNQALNDWQTQSGSVNLKDLNGNSHTLPTLKSLIADAQSVNPNPHVMTKAQFDALRDMRKQQYAGSGFVEWGKHNYSANNVNVNEGIWQYIAPSARNTLIMGEAASNRIAGISNTIYPTVNIDGVTHHVSRVAHTSTQSILKFPSAPDGTKTYDSASGTITQHSNAETAFAAETDTNKVITSRKDLVFLESWYEKIADKDVVFPLGNVQYGANNYKGIALRNNLVAQGYSAFGEWDTATKGHGIKWSSLTELQKAIFLGEPEHNIYYDPEAKAYIQVRYRVRVVEGLGNDWRAIEANTAGVLCYDLHHRVGKQGIKVETSSYVPHYTSNGYFSSISPFSLLKSDLGVFHAVEGINNNKFGHNGLCYALPIALVQRLNQGAYHPSYNSMGCGNFTRPDGNGITRWYIPKFSNVEPTSTVECFTLDYGNPDHMAGAPARDGWKKFGSIVGGSVNSGRPDQYKYHDAIYAGQVEDLRLNAKKQDVNALREETMRKAVAGELRGKSSLPALCVSGTFTVQTAAAESQNDGRIRIQTSLTGNQTFTFAYRFGGNSDVYLLSEEGDLLSIPLGMSKYSHIHVQFPINGNLYLGCSSFSDIVPLINDRFSGKKCRLIWAGQLSKPIGMINGGAKKPVNEEHSRFLSASHILYSHSASEFDSLPWVDIIGSPENIAATFPDGVIGQWIPKLPDGTAGYPLNRKLSGDTLSATFTIDQGQTWVKNNVQFDPVKNINSVSWDANTVALLQYESDSLFTHAATNSATFGDIGRVYATQAYLNQYGNRLQSSLTGQVGKRNSSAYFQEYLNISKHAYYSPNQTLGWTSRAGDEPIHELLNLDVPNDNSPAVKVLSTITEKNGLLYLQFHGAELKWQESMPMVIDPANMDQDFSAGTLYTVRGNVTGALSGKHLLCVRNGTAPFDSPNWTYTPNGFVYDDNGDQVYFVEAESFKGSWGDDQTIPIIDRENTKTDLNGNTVKVFCHHTLFPIGIAHNG